MLLFCIIYSGVWGKAQKYRLITAAHSIPKKPIPTQINTGQTPLSVLDRVGLPTDRQGWVILPTPAKTPPPLLGVLFGLDIGQ